MKTVILIVLGVITFSCSNNKKQEDMCFNLNVLDSINIDQIIDLMDVSVSWRDKTLLFWIQYNKDSNSIPIYITDTNNQFLLRKGQIELDMDNLKNYGDPILDSIFLQKDRIKYCYFLMNRYPLKRIEYIAKKKMIVVEIDTLKFVNIRDSSYLSNKNVKHLKDEWWIYNN